MRRPSALSNQANRSQDFRYVSGHVYDIRNSCSVHSRQFSQEESYYFPQNDGRSSLKGDADNLYIEGRKAVDLYNQFYQRDIEENKISTAQTASDMTDERFDMMLLLLFTSQLFSDKDRQASINQLKSNYSQNLMAIGAHLKQTEKHVTFKNMINLSRVDSDKTAIRCETFVAVDKEQTLDEYGDHAAYVPAKEISTFHAVSMSTEGGPFRLEAVNVSTGFLNLMGHQVAETFFEWLVTLYHRIMGTTDSLKEAQWEHTESNSYFIAQPILRFDNEGGSRPSALASQNEEQPNSEEQSGGPSFS